MNIREFRAIDFLKKVGEAYGNLYLGFSGGKDSIVTYDLARRAGISFTAQYGNTTLDPPGVIKFIRDHYPDVQIIHPVESFCKLVERKGLPTRQTRWCCEHLKEYIGIGKNTIQGVRAAESKNRTGRDYIQCDNRKVMKGAQHIYPIYDWSDEEIWEYIREYNLPVPDAYEKGCVRIGCVGCVLTSIPKRKFEFRLFPRYYDMIKRAIDKGMSNNPQWKLTVACDGDAETAMQWWLSNRSINQYFKDYTFEKINNIWTKTKKE